MKRLHLLSASTLTVLAVACSAPPPPEVEEPKAADVDSVPAAAASLPADGESGSQKVATDVAPTPAAAPEPVGQAAPGSLLDRMPKKCDGRAYIQIEKLFTGDSAASFSALLDKGLAKNKSATHADEVFAALKAGGVDPVKQVKEIAVCEGGGKELVAVQIDLSKAKDPGATLEKAIKAGDGEAPKKETVGDVTYLSSQKSDDVLAVVGKTTLLFGKDRATVEEAAKGGSRGAGYADAASYVVWVDAPDAKGKGTLRESGSDFVLDASVVDARLVREKESIMQKLKEVEANVGKLPGALQTLIKPLLPALRATKVSSEADTLKITTTFPKKTVPDVLAAAKKLGPDELAKLRL
jgi:hypothetical protein